MKIRSPQDLRDYAALCRLEADVIASSETRETLLQMASDYEVEAGTIEAGAPALADLPTPPSSSPRCV